MDPNTIITQKEFENIERYLNDSMSVEERKTFELDLKSNSTLTQHLDEQKLMHEAIETQSLKEQLDMFHEDVSDIKTFKRDTSKVISFNFRKLAVAAALIIAAGSFWFFNGSSNEKLYAKHFTPDPGLPTTMGETANFAFYDAMVNYKQGDYKTAISKWEVILQSKPKNDTLNYFLGVAHLANNNEDSAIQFLNNVTQNSTSDFNNDAFYYLGLAYLKADNIELAKKNLTFSTVDNSKNILSELED